MCILTILADLKTLAEIAALLSAAGFFLWKLRSGYLIVNAAISLKADRVHRDSSTDYLAVSVTLAKRGSGSLILHDARARFTHAQGATELEFIGYGRLYYFTDAAKGDRSTVVFSKSSSAQPFLFLTPDEEATFSTYTEVPRSLPCTIEVAVSGRRLGRKRIGQWRSSIVSLPLPE